MIDDGEEEQMRTWAIGGFTLIELMIVVAIVAVISAVALPIYSNYIGASREGTLVASIATIRVFQEDFRLRTGEYAEGTYDGAPDADLLPLGWDPGTDDIDFVIDADAGNTYTVTATDANGYSVCRRYPEGGLCP